jgi:hypothetical protein
LYDRESSQFARLEPVAREGGHQVAIVGRETGIGSRLEDVLHRAPAVPF